jgi:arylsulfatase A-like enzyme
MNTIFLFADQMHKYAMGSVSPFVNTPHLDALAERGTRFDSAYSNNPVCTPFRGIILSGQLSAHCGVKGNCDPLPADVPSLADAFNKAGYETAFVGKWHLGDKDNKPIPKKLRGGFRHFIGYQCYNGFYKDVCFYDEEDREHRFEEHREDVCTRYTIDYLKRMHKTGKPFFEMVSFQAPHYPVQPPAEYAALYKGKNIPVPPDFSDTEPYTPTFSPPSPRPFENCPDYQRYGGNMQEYLRLYYAMVSHLDACVGQIVKTLEDLGIREETNIVFTADHGDMQGSQGLKNKCLPYERSCGIPFIMSVPGAPGGLVCRTPVSAVDVYPTLLSLHGLPRESHLEGYDFSPLLRGETVKAPPLFCENYIPVQLSPGSSEKNTWKMVYDGKYKLTCTWEDKTPRLLYDMEKDPWEQRNLAGKGLEIEKSLARLIMDKFGNS